MTGLLGALLSATGGAAKGSGSVGVAAGLPAGQNLVEGTEANLMVGAAAANSSWRQAGVALGAALVTLIPILGGVWFLYKAGGAYADYAVGAVVVGIGVHEVMEGLKDRPKGDSQSRPHALAGPLGIDPADPDQIKKFQSYHSLKADGVLGPRTRGAILAELRRRGEQPRPNRLGVDVLDEESVRAFQRHVGLRPDGMIGPRTQGALAAESARRVPDAADADSVRVFQRRQGLPETGVVDARTQGALHAVINPADGSAQKASGSGAPDGAAANGADTAAANGAWHDGKTLFTDRIDLTNGAEIARFQRERGLPDSGVVDAMTQGALRAETEWHGRQLGLDPADPEAVSQFQAAHGLPQTGVVDAPTQASIRAARKPDEAVEPGRWSALGIDPTDQQSIKRFQALHGVQPSGEIDEDTRQELRRAELWTAGINPAEPASVRHFQAGHGLQATGVVDPETQGAMRLYRAELQRRYDDGLPEETPAWYPVDPTSPASIKGFQHERGLGESGTIDDPTQSALRTVIAERTRESLDRAEQTQDGGSLIDKYRDAWPGYFGVLLEGGEAGLFTIGIAQATGQYAIAAAAGGAAFVIPWVGLIWLRDWLQSRPQWVFELTIGGVLVTAGAIFGLLRATGVFG